MKQSKSYPKQASAPRMPKGNDEKGRFVSRDLCAVDPKKEQFEPTEAEPVRQHAKMAGAC